MKRGEKDKVVWMGQGMVFSRLNLSFLCWSHGAQFFSLKVLFGIHGPWVLFRATSE